MVKSCGSSMQPEVQRERGLEITCQQTLTGLYHNEVSVLEELRGGPANRPPQRAHIPTGQGSGLYVCVCVQKDAGCVYALANLTTRRKSCIFFGSFFFPLLALRPLLSLHSWLTLFSVTCDKLDGKAVFAVITVMTICLPLSKLCDKSERKSNTWCGRSQRGEGNCFFFPFFFF